MKQFIKTLDVKDDCLQLIFITFPGLSYDKIKTSVFDGTQIKRFTKCKNFSSSMTEVEKIAWNTFATVVKGFLGNTKAANYKDLMEILLDSFHPLGCHKSIKVDFRKSHLNEFPANLGDVSNEDEKPFHQDIKAMEERYRGRWNTHMTADYCLNIQRDFVDTKYSRLSRKRKFVP